MGIVTRLPRLRFYLQSVVFDNGLTEHEFDHVFTGTYQDPSIPKPGEVRRIVIKPIPEIRKPSGNTRMNIHWMVSKLFPRMELYLRKLIHPVKNTCVPVIHQTPDRYSHRCFLHAVGMVGLLYHDRGFFIQATPFNSCCRNVCSTDPRRQNISFFLAPAF